MSKPGPSCLVGCRVFIVSLRGHAEGDEAAPHRQSVKSVLTIPLHVFLVNLGSLHWHSGATTYWWAIPQKLALNHVCS